MSPSDPFYIVDFAQQTSWFSLFVVVTGVARTWLFKNDHSL